MALPAYPAALSLSAIQGEFGGTAPIPLSEYYAGAGRVAPNTQGFPVSVSSPVSIPSSGAISIRNFFGSSARRDQLIVLTGSGSYTVPSWVTNVDMVIIAGGGGGGSAYWTNQNDGGGGGGAGGVIYLANQTGYAGGTYSYSVGAGAPGANIAQAQNGGNTVFHTYTALGGGGGGGRPYYSPSNPTYQGTDKDGYPATFYVYNSIDGLPGGSGGGGNAYYGDGLAGAGTSGQGNAGGAGNGRPYGSQGDGFNGGGGGKGGPGYNNWYGLAYPGAPPLRITGGQGIVYTWYSYSSAENVSTDGIGGGGGAGSGFGNFELYPDHGVYAYPGYGGGNGAFMGNGNGLSGTAGTGGGGGGGHGLRDYGSQGGNGGSGKIFLFLKNY